MARLALKRMSTGHATAEGFGVDLARRGGMTGLNAGLRDEAERGAVVFEDVDECEGNVFLAGQAALDRCKDFFLGIGVDQRAGKGT